MANPYSGGGNATSGGGNGTWSTASSDVSDYTVPNVNFLNSGFATAYIVDDITIKELREKLWSIIGSIEHYFTKADEAIFGCYKLPINPSNIPSAEYSIVLGLEDTDIQGDIPNNQFYTINFGSLSIEEWSGSFLDYDNNTQIILYLPYIGNVTLDTNIVMGNILNLKYIIDLYTGNFEAQLYSGSSLAYTFQGNCAYNIPISSINYAQTIESTVRTAATVATTIGSIVAAI